MNATVSTSRHWYRRRRNVVLGLAGLVLVGAVGAGAGLWYILVGFPAPAAASADIAAGVAAPAPASFDGAWQVNDSLGSYSDFSSSWLGYRVQEQFIGVGGHTAVGRTPKVTGTMTLKGSTVTSASITGDLTALTSDAPQRDGELGDSAIESSTFPTATFVLTNPIDLGSLPSDATSVTVTASGRFTLHGVTRDVQVSLQALRKGGVIAVSGSLPVVFSDYGFKGPTVLNFVTVNDHGTMELHLLFTHA